MTGILRAGLVQHACGPDPDANLAACEAGIEAAAARGAGLVLTQELFRSPYFCQTEDPAAFALAEPVPGPTTARLAALAARLQVVLVASLFERRAAGLYHNTTVVLDRDRGLVGRYRKMHIPDDPGYYEKYYFTPGDLGFRPIDTSLGRLGVLVCWDQWFPEAARLMALAGAEILLYPTAIGWDPRDPAAEQSRQREAWMIAQRAHAIANGLPLLACNRCGFEPEGGFATRRGTATRPSDGDARDTESAATEPGTHAAGQAQGEPGTLFWGTSFACGPQGELLAQAPADGPAVLLADLDLERTETVRRWWPYLRDRRIDAYGGLTARYLDPD